MLSNCKLNSYFLAKMKPITIYTIKLTEPQASLVRTYLVDHDFELQKVPYARFAGSDPKLTIVFYESGKLVVQGKGTEDFVKFYLEPNVLREVRLGYDEVLNPRAFEPHMGVDESGKGDYFGPIVIGAVYASKEGFLKFRELGVRDSKAISSDAKAIELAKGIRVIPQCVAEAIIIGPQAYNRLHAKMQNVNSILGWGHARAIENVLAKIASRGGGNICHRAISDQFGNKRIIQEALMERGRKIELEQRHRAEEDLAVAAASIIARAEFILALRKLGKRWGIQFPKGASDIVIERAREFVSKHGKESLPEVAKLHFRTTQKVANI